MTARLVSEIRIISLPPFSRLQLGKPDCFNPDDFSARPLIADEESAGTKKRAGAKPSTRLARRMWRAAPRQSRHRSRGREPAFADARGGGFIVGPVADP
jgi:hypothetical protein